MCTVINEKIDLYDHFNIDRNGADGGYLQSYVTAIGEINKKRRPAMLILPGGAYRFLSEREGEPVALKFLSNGFSSFVLKYTVCAAYPTPLVEACMAMAYIRENADKYFVDAKHVGAIGFSAGGNLCAMLATIWNEKEIVKVLGAHVEKCRPDAVVLSYPVATLDIMTHGETCSVITGDDEKLRKRISPDKRVTSNSSPAFIWHTCADDAVDVENAFIIAAAYKKANAPFALHLFERGWHGLALCSTETSDDTPKDKEMSAIGKWFELAVDWLTAHGFAVTTVAE